MNQPQQEWVRKPLAPPAHIKYAHNLGRGMFTFEQSLELVKAINSTYVARKNNMTYLSQHQARAEMNRIFGYGNWDSEVVMMRCDYEERLTSDDPRWPKDKSRNPKTSGSGAYWIVGYEGAVRVTVRDLWGMPVATYLEHHFEESAPQPNRGEARALALTSVESYALRRALINLGDRFGLGLYDKGSLGPHGQYTVQLEPGQLFRWELAGGQQQGAAQAPYAQPTHETIQASQATGDGFEFSQDPTDYDDAEPDGQGGVRSKTLDGFRQAQAKVQEANTRQRAQLPAGMAERIQGGFKQDTQGQG